MLLERHLPYTDQLKILAEQTYEYQTEGMNLALTALYNIIAQPNATHATSNTQQDYMTIQSDFIESEVALMYPCGGFLETELEKHKQQKTS